MEELEEVAEGLTCGEFEGAVDVTVEEAELGELGGGLGEGREDSF